MKLYLNANSERGKQVNKGGNEYIEIKLKAFDRNHPIGIIVLEVMTDSNDKKNQYLLTWKDALWNDPMILREGHEKEGLIQTAEIPLDKQKAKHTHNKMNSKYPL